MEYNFKPGDIVAIIVYNAGVSNGFYEIQSILDGIITGKSVGNTYNDIQTFNPSKGIIIPWSYDEASEAVLHTHCSNNLRQITDDDWIYRVEIDGQGLIVATRGVERCRQVAPHPCGSFHSIWPFTKKLEDEAIRTRFLSYPGAKVYRYIFGSVFIADSVSSFIDHSKPYERIEIKL